MDTLKRFVRGLCSQLFKLSIYLAAVSAAVITVFGTPQNIKNTLKTSGAYTKAVDSVIDQAKKEQGDDGTGQSGSENIPIDDPAVRAAIKNALPADFVEQTANQAIDGFFGWLQGKTETPRFSIDLTNAKQKLASGIADTAYQRASGLPVCTAAQLRTMNIHDIDFFTMPCVPPGINLQAERDKLAANIAAGGDVLKDSTITTDDLPKKNGKTVFDQAKAVPTAYQWFVRSPWILGILALLSAAGLVLLHDDRRRGIWLIGRALLISGVLLILSGLIANYAVDKAPLNGQASLQLSLADLIRTVVHQFDAVLVKFGAIYAVIGVGAMLAIHFTKPKELQQKPVAETTDVPDSTKPTEEPAPQPTEEKTKE